MYQEAYDALAQAMREVDAPGTASDGDPEAVEGPSALQVVESLLTRVRVAFRRGSTYLPPDLWLERISFIKPDVRGCFPASGAPAADPAPCARVPTPPPACSLCARHAVCPARRGRWRSR